MGAAKKHPFVIVGMFTLREINFFFVVVIRGAWQTCWSSDAPRVNRLQKNPRRSPRCAERQRDATWIPLLAFLSPGPPTADGSRGDMEIILLACVSERATSELGEPGWSGHQKLTPSHPPVAGYWGIAQGGEVPLRGARCRPSSTGCQGIGSGNHLGGFLRHVALGLPWIHITHRSPCKSRSHPREAPLRFLGLYIFWS